MTFGNADPWRDECERLRSEIARLTDEQSRLARHLVEQHDAIARLTEQRDALAAELKLMEHKVLTCGVAASHSDASLSRRAKDYGGPWDSPQAEAVRVVREQRDALLAACEAIASFGCINRARVMRDTTCGECDPCTARAAIEQARGGDHG